VMRDVRRSVRENWPYMLIAFALAVALWLGVSAEAATQQDVPVRLIVQNLDPRYVLTSRPPTQVAVTFHGPARDLLQLTVFSRPRPVVVTVDRVRSLVQVVELRPEMVGVPEGVKATPIAVDPPTLRLRFEPAAQRQVPIVPRVDARPAEGFALAGPVEVTPTQATVTGAQSAVRALDTLWTVPLRLENLSAPVDRELEVERPDVESPLELWPETVRVRIPVEPAEQRVVEGVRVEIADGEGNLFVALPAEVRVQVRGAQSRVAGVRPEDLEARVRLRRQAPTEGWYAVEARTRDPYLEAAALDSVRVVALRARGPAR
jgi:YbbR domain-containing protein